MLVHWMRFVERLLFVWAGFLAANVAILASALPYIYTNEDPMRCGSLGITRFAIESVPASILAIVFLAVTSYIGRAWMSARNRWNHVPVVGWMVNYTAA